MCASITLKCVAGALFAMLSVTARKELCVCAVHGVVWRGVTVSVVSLLVCCCFVGFIVLFVVCLLCQGTVGAAGYPEPQFFAYV